MHLVFIESAQVQVVVLTLRISWDFEAMVSYFYFCIFPTSVVKIHTSLMHLMTTAVSPELMASIVSSL